MKTIVDSHLHVFPNYLLMDFSSIKNPLRKKLAPLVEKAHHLQSYLRILPDPMRRLSEELSAFLPMSGLLLESAHEDLRFSMARSNVDYALVIAHPPFITNEFVFELCAENKSLFPVINLPPSRSKKGKELKRLLNQGAKAIKIHPASDGEGPDSPHYDSLLRAACEYDLPVIIHTGCFHSHFFYKNPDLGDVQLYSKWFKTYPDIRFVLAHMNFDEPRKAIELAQDHSNVYLETSWQPPESIGDAVRKLGAGRVMFGSDWPFIGRNQEIAIRRIYECFDLGWLSETELDQVLGKNALEIFKIHAE